MSNCARISGFVTETPEHNHTNNGEDFYMTTVSAKRKSGTLDRIKVLLPERLFNCNLESLSNTYISLTGRFQSCNHHTDDGKSRLKLFFFATDTFDQDEYITDDANSVDFDGYICKEPIHRSTPLGREITDLLVAVNRSYGKSDYIPCIAWGRNARYAATLKVGDHIKLSGRMQSREYQNSAGEKKTAYEISVRGISCVEEDVAYE